MVIVMLSMAMSQISQHCGVPIQSYGAIMSHKAVYVAKTKKLDGLGPLLVDYIGHGILPN